MKTEFIPFAVLLLIIGGFFLGSVMFSRWLPMWFMGIDVCEIFPDKNPGAGNVFKSCGIGPGLLCLAMDILKGFVPIFTAVRLGFAGDWFFTAIAAAPVLGHAIAPLNGFHGGKCIATTFGTLLGMVGYSPLVFYLAVIYILFSTVLKINPNRRRSIVTFALFGVLGTLSELWSGRLFSALDCVAVSVTAAVRHIKSPDEQPISQTEKISDRRKRL